eukprot:GCRY01001711.1.p1 GENE.GCRY01001711.1~~GCRY01001711.1.p1  ORF type:complete len:395 (+),score=25.35 GCRY01001711.1:256-1440(+)
MSIDSERVGLIQSDAAPLSVPVDFSDESSLLLQIPNYKENQPEGTFLFPPWLEDRLFIFENFFIRLIQSDKYFSLRTNSYLHYFCLLWTALTCIEIFLPVPFLLYLWGEDTLCCFTLCHIFALTFISQIPKRFFWRSRPFVVGRAKGLRDDQTSSFPSRAATCAVVYGYLLAAVLTYHKGAGLSVWSVDWPLCAPIILAAWLVTSVVRIRVGVHYMFDCLAGIIQAILVIAFGTLLYHIMMVNCDCDGVYYSWPCYTVYSAGDASPLTDSTLGFYGWTSLSLLTGLGLLFQIVATIPPVKFWVKGHRVFGLLFPVAALFLTTVCPSMNPFGSSLPEPPEHITFGFLFYPPLLSLVVFALSHGNKRVFPVLSYFYTYCIAVFIGLFWRLYWLKAK